MVKLSYQIDLVFSDSDDLLPVTWLDYQNLPSVGLSLKTIWRVQNVSVRMLPEIPFSAK